MNSKNVKKFLKTVFGTTTTGTSNRKRRVVDLPPSKPITESPIDDKSDIIFSIRKHEDGKYSCEIKQIPSENEELDNYAKWLAGTFGRSIINFEEMFSTVVDESGVCEQTTFPLKD